MTNSFESILNFIQLVKKANRTGAKEVRISLVDANEISTNLALLLLENNQLLKQKSETVVELQIKGQPLKK